MQELNLSFDLDSLEGSGNKNGIETIAKGDSFYRILPPFGTNHGGRPWAYWALHFGIKDDKGRSVPLVCSYNVEKYCPICEKVWAAEEEIEKLLQQNGVKTVKELPVQDAEIAKKLGEFVYQHRADKAFYTNAVTVDGHVVKLKLKPSLITGMRQEKEGQLIKKIKEAVKDYRIDPLSLDLGIPFKFTREGESFSTSYSVNFKETVTTEGGRIRKEIVPSSIAAEFPQLYEAIKQQLATGGEGPLSDVHALYDRATSADLKLAIEKGILPPRRQRTARPEAAPASTAPAAQQQVAIPQVTAAPMPMVVVAPAPVAPLTPVASVDTTAPVAPAAPTTSSAKATSEVERLKQMGLIK